MGCGGKAVITLTGKEAGTVCVLRMAYARSYLFDDDYENYSGDDLIKFPVIVIGKDSDVVCNPSTDSDCFGGEFNIPI